MTEGDSRDLSDLPEPSDRQPWPSDRPAAALREISGAMAYASSGDRGMALTCVRAAVAEVRGLRKSLDVHSAPLSWPHTCVRLCFLFAIKNVIWADEAISRAGSTEASRFLRVAAAENLRSAEAWLWAAAEHLNTMEGS